MQFEKADLSTDEIIYKTTEYLMVDRDEDPLITN